MGLPIGLAFHGGLTFHGGMTTMDLGDLLAPEGVIASLKAKSKKQALQELAQRASEISGIEQREIFDSLLQRERLGSTGFGRGIAIPHVKFRSLKSIICVFARIETPIDFESPDNEPVDLVFLLLAPEHASGDHLKALARISRLVRDPAMLERLRTAPDATALREVLTAAVMQLDLSENQFLVFRNAAHGGLNVVYRRRDGNIGWIDPNGRTVEVAAGISG